MMPPGFICLVMKDGGKKDNKEEVLNSAEFYRAGVSRGTLDQPLFCTYSIRSLMHKLKSSGKIKRFTSRK